MDFPKLHSPFVRQDINNKYVATPKVDEDYSWVFDDGVKAVDKIDGTNVCVIIKDGNIHRVFNRKTEKFVFNVHQGKWEGFALEGISKAIQRGMLKGVNDGCYYGELIGEAFNKNRHQVKGYLFVPFDYLVKNCHWNSWLFNEYPKNFETISEWFKDLPSLFNKKQKLPDIQAEGLVFYHPDGRMCKLRRDMFDWSNEKHK